MTDVSIPDQAPPTAVPAPTPKPGGQAEAGWETGVWGSRLRAS